jgi:hypothetical protein
MVGIDLDPVESANALIAIAVANEMMQNFYR